MGSSSSKAERRQILSEKPLENDKFGDSGIDSVSCSSESDTDSDTGKVGHGIFWCVFELKGDWCNGSILACKGWFHC